MASIPSSINTSSGVVPIANTSTVSNTMDPTSLLTTMADVLRLPEECLGMSFLYLNRYQKFHHLQNRKPPLDEHMLALASLSLASKATEAPRRLREFLLPAWRLMQHRKPQAEPLTFPSTTYDSLRSTLVQAELMLLRVLKFELRIPLPFDFLPDYLGRTIGELNVGDGTWGGTDDFEALDRERREGCRVVDLMETGVAKACREKAMNACKNYRLANFFTAKTLAAACVYVVLHGRGLVGGIDVKSWLRDKASRTIDVDDFEEAVSLLDKT